MHTHFHKSKNRGTTLIEVLVYIVIFAFLTVTVMNALIVTTKSFAATRSNHYMLDAGNSAMERISREIRGALSVDNSNSTFNSSPGILQLNTLDSNGAAKTVKFSVASQVLQLTENGTLTGDLTSGNVNVTSLIFRSITTTSGSAVKVELTIQDAKNTSSPAQNFYDTIILRGGY